MTEDEKDKILREYNEIEGFLRVTNEEINEILNNADDALVSTAVNMNSSDKLWEIKRLEYTRDDCEFAKTSCKARNDNNEMDGALKLVNNRLNEIDIQIHKLLGDE